jgi:hypothetical protein
MSDRNPFTMARPPELSDPEPKAVLNWTREQLTATHRSLLDTTALELRQRHDEPQRPRVGMLAYADGSDWNPRLGEGLYAYDGAAWIRAGGGYIVLGSRAVAVSHTGNTTETTLATVVVPAGAMGANGALRVWTLWSHTNGANNKTLRVKLSTTAFVAIVNTSTATFQDLVTVMNRNSASSQLSHAAAQATRFGASTSAVTTGSVDTSSAQNLTITGQLATGSDSVTLEGYSVELFYKV